MKDLDKIAGEFDAILDSKSASRERQIFDTAYDEARHKHPALYAALNPEGNPDQERCVKMFSIAIFAAGVLTGVDETMKVVNKVIQTVKDEM